MVAIATAGRGPEEKTASGRMHQALGRQAAAGTGTAIRVFWMRRNRGGGGGCVTWHIIHLIAIRKTVPAPATRLKTEWPSVGRTTAVQEPLRPWTFLHLKPVPTGSGGSVRGSHARTSGEGVLYQIAIGWMLCPGEPPSRGADILLLKKFGWPSPRRQQRIYQGSLAPPGSQPSGPRSAVATRRSRRSGLVDSGHNGWMRS
jgi:hypothetical protein